MNVKLMLRRSAMAATAAVLTSCASARPALPRGNAASLGFSPAALATISSSMQAYVDSGKLAGVYAVIVRHGRIAYEHTVGWKNLEHKKPLHRDDIFRVYSMTKPITAAGMMRLVDMGKVTLDDPVAKFIPSFAQMKVFTGGSASQPILVDAATPMTIRELLTHTSGLAYGTTSSPIDTIFNAARVYRAEYTVQEFADSVAKLPLFFSPGTGWNYSSGIDVAGRVIEAASGQSLGSFLKEQILDPIGMTSTAFRRNEIDQGRLTTLYERAADGKLRAINSSDGLQKMYEPDAKFFWGSGGLLSTPDDYMRFTQMLMNGGVANGKRVLSEASVREMTRNQIAPALIPIPMGDRGYGFGLAMSVLVDSTMATRPGPNGIYRWSGYVGTYFWNDPVNDMTAMIWTQLSPGSTYPLERVFQKQVYQAMVH